MSRRGNIKKKTSVEPVRHRPESAARGFERTAEWIFYACLVLGATVVAPQDFFDWSEPPKLFTVQVGAAAILCLWLCAAALRGSLRVRLPAVLLPLGFTAVVAVLSVAWSVNPGLAVERLYHVGSLALFLVFALWLYRGQDVKGALYLIIFISAGIALWGLVLDLVDPLRNWVYPNFLEQRGGHWINNIRPLTSTQGNPNFLLHVLVMAVPAALGALVHCLLERQEIVRRTRRVLILALAGSFLLPLACFARSQNRSSLVAVFLALLLFFVISLVINRGQMFSFFQTCRKHAPRFLAGLALAALAAAAAIGFTDRGRSFALSFTSSAQARLAYWGTRFGNLTDLENIDVYSRVVLFETSTAMIADNPLLGKGIGQFQVYYPGYKTVEHWEKFPLLTPEIKRWSEIPAFAHNEWLQVFLELGVFAFASFLLFWILLGLMVLGVLRRSAGDPRFFLVLGIAAAIAGALFNALLTFPLQTITSGMFFWGLVGLLLVQCEVFVPGGRLREFDLTLRIKPVAAKLALAAGAVMILALCTWGSVRIIRSQYLLFDALKNHARRLDYSIRQVDKAARLDPFRFEFHYVRGWLGWLAGDTTAARVSFERSLDRAPYFPEPRKYLASLAFRNGDYRLAEKYCSRYMRTYPRGNTPEMKYIQGMVCLADSTADRIAGADSLLRSVGTLDALMGLASGYRQRGKPASAMELMPLAMRKVSPRTNLRGYLSVTAYFGHTALAAGDTAAAREQFKQIISTLDGFAPEGYEQLREQTGRMIEELR